MSSESTAPVEAGPQQHVPEAGPSRPAVQVYRPPAGDRPMFIPPITPEEPKATPAELKMAFKDHIAGRHGPDAPLMTKAMRDKEEARLGKTKKTWSLVKIRIRFADRTQIESTFPSDAPISAVYSFVRDALDSAVLASGKRFTLFTAPPRRDFLEQDPKTRGQGLAQLGLVPAAVLSVRWDDASMNSSSSPAPLKAELLSAAVELPAAKTFEPPPAAPPTGALGGARTLGGGPAGDDSGEKGKRDPKNPPKWLKGIIKK